ncbi:DUF3021 family protein [Fusibacter sp. Q10-2]|uniref:DUF3021 family protein n=2 Tax=Fusibacter ferrireducens TaxID=2785058 RepID=A0ABR9ZZV5_9FIRM|nr:DUF3021 family protein [Fusibacter ferrireducens]
MHLIKKLTQVATLIFTILIVIRMLSGLEVSNQMLWQLLFVALIASLMKVVMFKETLFNYHWAYQLGYLFLIWLSLLIFGMFFKWHMTLGDAAMNLLLVFFIYGIIRVINYRQDKIEVDQMNDYLKKKRRKKEA